MLPHRRAEQQAHRLREGVLARRTLAATDFVATFADGSTDSVTFALDGVIVRTEGMKVAVLNHWYRDREEYAVFVTTPEQLTPILLPDTVLPDGGTPHSFPNELYFDDGTVAFDSSTSLDLSERWFVHFPTAGIRFSLAVGDLLPGTDAPITRLGAMLNLTRDLARYEVRTDRSHVVETHSDGSHQVVASAIPVPDSSIVGYGTYFGAPLVAYDETAEIAYFRGAIKAAAPIGGEYRMVADERPVRGLDVQELVITGAHDGKVYGLADDATGNRVVVEATPTFEKPAPRIRGIGLTPDGTLRLDVANLTLGQSYTVERFDHAARTWTAVGEFEPFAATRSVLATHEPGSEELFRLRHAPQ